MIRLAGITTESVVDGPGLRTVIWTQGCPHRCPGCHNPDTHDPEGGELWTFEQVFAELEGDKLATGITLSGGEPFFQPEACLVIARWAREKGKNLWVFTGYTWEQLMRMSESNPVIGELLQLTDVLVDGPYLKEQRALWLPFRGSTNQRLIDVPASLASGSVCIIDDNQFGV
ncbi:MULTISPECIES: anaerobic ribonucleoside-triphosphate reductase activating protein [Carboxydocella]|uniref:Anaerobic ribonucleoside-triphosphate reductase-activating protein n=2 Tax=Carboxydocella TaxID=178898 RepID=A0A1T4Q7Y4_9FIRM|nr:MULTISPECIES: anaerobic ribonucleoside-triphosphate reductase activating protein [Carboxydocella]AVX19327.1 anaerobic ribonucleoside-triphosphate reductase activating protein [Carboxydocella thermautotrophica]AVX29741.1 anaerobic ribonucleoside-triphosphate reductase activating protein [Carboxydocella thermautotrophica]SJZ99839.1 anaerobic ribonucleoside-triphosphate reductase activating protein [Carboxydocella sporoproducens DSM 16521]GAW27449.1 anaerobic ribonucleoside-triphosphate reducta